MSSVRVLPKTPVDEMVNMLLMRRSDLEGLITLQIDKDGTVIVCGTEDDPYRLVGMLEHIKKDVLDSLTCSNCGQTTVPTGPEDVS